MSHSRRLLFRSLGLMLVFAMLVAACGGAEDATTDAPTDTGAAATDAPATEGDGEAFYAGESIRYIIPTSAGGGAGAIGEFVRPYWQENIPGQPSIEIDYLSGAGGTAGGNEFALRAEADGLTVMQGTLSSATAYLLGEEQVQYDMSVWDPIISFPVSGVIHARTDSGIASIEDLAAYEGDELFIGGRAPTASDIMHVLALEVLGLREKVSYLWGYGGNAEQLLAIEQGETQLDGTTDNAFLSNGSRLVDEGITTVLLSYGIPNGEGGFDRNPNIDAPTVDEAHRMLYGEDPSGPAWDAYLTAMGIMQVATVVVLPEGTDPAAREAWRTAVATMVSDTDFVDQSVATLNPNAPATSDEELELVKASLFVDADIRAWIRELLETNYADAMG